MKLRKPTLRICKKGHEYYKSSNCLTCPICEQQNKPNDNFLALLSAPARRALGNEKITSLKQLAKYSESELLQLHGFGPGSLPKLRVALANEGLSFKQ